MPQAEWDEVAVDTARVLCLDCFKRAALLNGVNLEVS